MSCDDSTPWTLQNHPHAINRIRVTGGSETNQSSGEWTAESTSSIAVVGCIGRGTSASTTGTFAEDLERLAGGQFKTGDQMFQCHGDCDVALNDILEVYGDAAGSTKTYWRVVSKLKTLQTFENLLGYGRQYFLIRREER